MMTNIKTWEEHLNELPDIQIVTNDDVRGAMLNEIDDLRAALVKSSEDVVNITRERNALKMSADKWFDITVQLEKEKYNLIRECTSLKEKITEMRLQYISDFGQLLEREQSVKKVSWTELVQWWESGNEHWEVLQDIVSRMLEANKV